MEFAKPRSGQLTLSHLVSKSHLGSNKVVDGRPEGHGVLIGDTRGRGTDISSDSGSAAVGAAQAVLGPFSPASGKCTDPGDG